MITTRKLVSSLAVATVLSLVVTAAHAAGEQTAAVKAWDLDLSKPADVQALYERVHAAANSVCRAEAQRHYRNTRMATPLGWRNRCVNETVEASVRQIANAHLAALHGQSSRASRQL